MKYLKINIIFSLFSSLLFAQWQVAFSSFSIYDDNIFNTYNKTSDTYFVPGINIVKSTPQMDYYFSNTSILLKNNPDLNNTINTVGMDYFKTFSENLYGNFGLNLSGRFNKEDFDYYDYYKMAGYINFKWYSMENGLTKLYLKAQGKQFPVEDSWNHYEFSLKIQQQIYLQTGTTLRFDVEPIVRNFIPYSWEYENVAYEDELPTLWQAVFNFRIAQSITRNFGGYTEFMYRYNPSETNPYDPLIQSFSPIDDYFGYGGYEWKTNLKYKLTENLWLTTSGELYHDTYKNRAIYEYDFDAEEFVVDEEGYYIPLGKNRIDTGFFMNFGVSYQLSKLFGSPSHLFLDLEYSNQVNESNDPYFGYKNNSVTMQLNYNFQF